MIQIRRASINDVPTLVRFRSLLFKEMGLLRGEQEEKSFERACELFFTQFIPQNEFLSWIAEDDKKVVAVSGLVFFQKPPSPGNNSGKEAYIMNMYTLKEWRKKGIASKLLKKITAFLNQMRIISISLHTTEVGRTVYEKFGFSLVDTEMKLLIEQNQ
ncbi:MAG: GNAT family N-acetyltransferase [Candidatus Heimdallarchaeota archaeon]|nr:MAG: GNAT family N-acetyltransferase [Candidatus Heimdallarchaeota archaeon]